MPRSRTTADPLTVTLICTVGANQLSFGNKLTLVPISRSGKNALDFQLSYYVGYITSRNPNARFVVVSNDQGYGPMLDHAKELGFAVSHLGFGSPKAPVKKKVAKKAATPKTVAKKAVPAKKSAPVKKAPVAKKSPKADKSPAAKTPKKATAAPVAAKKLAQLSQRRKRPFPKQQKAANQLPYQLKRLK